MRARKGFKVKAVPGSLVAPILEMLTCGADCTGTIPSAFVARAAAWLFPSAGTRREHLARGRGLVEATVPQDLGHGRFASLGALMPRHSVGMAKPGTALLLGAEWPPQSCLQLAPSFVMLEGQKRLLATPSLDGGDRPAAAPHRRAQGRGWREMPSSHKAGQARRAPLSCVTPHQGTCHPVKPDTWSRRDTRN